MTTAHLVICVAVIFGLVDLVAAIFLIAACWLGMVRDISRLRDERPSSYAHSHPPYVNKH